MRGRGLEFVVFGYARVGVTMARTTTMLLVATLLASTLSALPVPTTTQVADAGAGPAQTIYVGDGMTTSPTPQCAAPSYTTGDYGSAYGAITAALAGRSNGDVIHLCAGTYDLTAGLTVAAAITIRGDGSTDTTVRRAASVPATTYFPLLSAVDIALSDLTLSGAFNALDSHPYTAYGGAVTSTGTVDVVRTRFEHNYAATYGGAVHAQGDVHIEDSRFVANSTNSLGGAVFAGGNASVTDGIFVDNTGGSGGAIFATTDIRVLRSTFLGNNTGTTGSLESGGALNATVVVAIDSRFEANRTRGYGGGAILASGGAEITGSTFIGNLATKVLSGGGVGGAIAADDGTTTIDRSYFAGNSAVTRGGAIATTDLNGSGGGGDIVVTNSTFTDNSSGQGGSVSVVSASFGSWVPVTVRVRNATFVANRANQKGGSIAVDGLGYGALVEITNGTFIDDTAATGGAISVEQESGTPTVTARDSLFVGGSCAVASGSVAAVGTNLRTALAAGCAGDVTTRTSLALGTLEANGGPTPTVRLLPGSAAIDATTGIAGQCGSGTDQRGRPRPAGTGCDIGAFEYSPTAYVGDGTTGSTTGECVAPDFATDAYATDDAAIQAAVYSAGPGGTVHLCAGTYRMTASVTVTSGDITFRGDSSTDTIIDRADSAGFSFFRIGHPTSERTFMATFERLTIQHAMNGSAYPGGLGSAISGEQAYIGTIVISSSRFIENEAREGGAIGTPSALRLVATTFTGNYSYLEGGALNVGGGIEITGGAFVGNHAREGGAISVSAPFYSGVPALRTNGTDFIDNTAGSDADPRRGGAVIASIGRVDVSGGTFAGNQAWRGGALVYDDFGNGEIARITGVTFTNNSAGDGGAIYLLGGGMEISGATTFTGNRATNGGAIGSEASLTVRGASFSDNTAGSAGGALVARYPSSVTVIGGQFTSNVSGLAGGAIWSENQLSVRDALFTGNRAGYSGGAVLGNGTIDVSTSTFFDNSSGSRCTPQELPEGCIGGAIVSIGSLAVHGSLFQANRTTGRGGAIARTSQSAATITVARSTFTENTAGSEGGGIFAEYGTTSVTASTFVDNVGDAAGSPQGRDNLVIYVNNGTVRDSLFVGGGCIGSQGNVGNVSASASGCPGTSVARADLRLGALTNNGGPTKTIAIGKGSPAIDPVNGSATCTVATDQRGQPRPSLGRCDAGAYEYQAAAFDHTTAITISGTSNGADLTAGVNLTVSDSISLQAIVSSITLPDVTTGQVLFAYCRSTVAIPTDCTSGSWSVAGTADVTAGDTASDGRGVARLGEWSAPLWGYYRIGAAYLVAGGEIGSAETTAGSTTFQAVRPVIVTWDATAGSAVLASGTSVPLRAVVTQLDGSAAASCGVGFTISSFGVPGATVTGTSNGSGLATSSFSNVTAGVYVITVTTGDGCLAATPAWGVVTIGATTYPKGTVGTVAGGWHYVSGTTGTRVTFGMRVDATTSTAGKGKTAVTTTRTNIQFSWVSADGWLLEVKATGDQSTGTQTPWLRETCPSTASDGTTTPVATLARGTICGRLAYSAILYRWVGGAWSSQGLGQFVARVVDGGTTRSGDNTDWFAMSSISVGSAPTSSGVRPLRSGYTSGTFWGRAVIT